MKFFNFCQSHDHCSNLTSRKWLDPKSSEPQMAQGLPFLLISLISATTV